MYFSRIWNGANGNGNEKMGQLGLLFIFFHYFFIRFQMNVSLNNSMQ